MNSNLKTDAKVKVIIIKLVQIPPKLYDEYKLSVIFDGYKHDPQFGDNNTVARHAVILTRAEHEELTLLTEALDKETVAAENLLCGELRLARPIGIPFNFYFDVRKMQNYDPARHLRLMRYDFHPVCEGDFAVSEVNSDVPGGLAEATAMTRIAARYLDGAYGFISFGALMVEAIAQKTPPGGRVAFVHCTSYSDDRQPMQFLGDMLAQRGFKIIYCAADHINFKDQKALCVLSGHEGAVDVIFRFTPIEWLIGIRPKRWSGYFDTVTCSCNHPVAIFAQSKRFPFVWDALERHGLEFNTWRRLLPETLDVKAAKGKDGFIYKPVYGRVGERITIKEACRGDEYAKTMKEVRRFPKDFLAQKKFNSRALICEDDGTALHVCIGVYTVEGRAAGYFARASKTPRIDSYSADIPVLIEDAP